MFILAWSTYGTEVCATFAPEYKSIQDTHRALRSAAMFMLLVCLLLPLGLGGVSGVNAAVATGAEGQFYTSAMTDARRPRRGIVLHDLHHRARCCCR